MALTVSFDRPSYSPGDTMKMTISVAAGERDQYKNTPGTVHIEVPGVGAADATYTLKQKLPDPVPVTVDDPSGKVWTVVTDNGVTQVRTATA